MSLERRAENPEGQPAATLKERLKEYSLRIIRMYCALPKTQVARVLGGQVLRSGTSPGAHHREASRARSTAEFISKMEGGLQELDETSYWLELLVGSGSVPHERMQRLLDETEELIAIFTASVKTAKRRKEGER
jgi:four helix bundle protein